MNELRNQLIHKQIQIRACQFNIRTLQKQLNQLIDEEEALQEKFADAVLIGEEELL